MILFHIVSNQNILALRLVTNLNNFSVIIKRALMSANLFGINVDLVIINKVDVQDEDKRRFFENTKFNFLPLPCREAIRMKKNFRVLKC